MAAYRKISVTFWADSFVQTLTPEGKYFYLYLMTNTRTTQCGIYEITLNQMCFETGYNQETINKLLTQFEKTGRVKYSKLTNEIALKNWPKYNESTSPKVKACVEKELKLVKNRVLIQYLYSIDTQPQETKEETKAKPKEEAQTFDELFLDAFDEITCESYKVAFKGIDLGAELQKFRIKCDNDKSKYYGRDVGGLRTAFQYQLQNVRTNGKRKSGTIKDGLNEIDAILERERNTSGAGG